MYLHEKRKAVWSCYNGKGFKYTVQLTNFEEIVFFFFLLFSAELALASAIFWGGVLRPLQDSSVVDEFYSYNLCCVFLGEFEIEFLISDHVDSS